MTHTAIAFRLPLLLALAAGAGCSKSTAAGEINAGDLLAPVPAGYTVASTIVPEHGATLQGAPPEGRSFPRTIVIQQLRPADLPAAAALAAFCQQAAEAVAAGNKATVVSSEVVTLGPRSGCKNVIEAAASSQHTTQYAVSDGTTAFSVVCNRDAHGDPDADAACLAVVGAIRPR